MDFILKEGMSDSSGDCSELILRDLAEQDVRSFSAWRAQFFQVLSDEYGKRRYICPNCGSFFITVTEFREDRMLNISRCSCSICKEKIDDKDRDLDNCLICPGCLPIICDKCIQSNVCYSFFLLLLVSLLP